MLTTIFYTTDNTLNILSPMRIRAGSPSRGGDVADYVFDINQPSLPTSFRSVLVSICVFMALLNCISLPQFSQQLSSFSLCSSGLISALLVLSAIYLFMKAVSYTHLTLPTTASV